MNLGSPWSVCLSSSRFLEINESWSWAEDHGIELSDRRTPKHDASYRPVWREVFAHGLPSGEEPRVARRLVEELGDWDECLLWVVTWGVWSSTEDWPAYYAARGRLGERRSLDVAPGLLVGRADQEMLIEFVTVAMTFGWDAHVLPARSGEASARRGFVSHDEWAELRERSSTADTTLV